MHLYYNVIMNKDKIYTIRFTPREWEGICKRAGHKDMPISEYLRMMIDLGEKADYAAKSDTITW